MPVFPFPVENILKTELFQFLWGSVDGGPRRNLSVSLQQLKCKLIHPFTRERLPLVATNRTWLGSDSSQYVWL